MWNFPHSLPKSSNFCVIGHATWRVTNVLWASEVNSENTRKGWVIVCFKNKILNSSGPLSSSNSISSSFLVHLEWFQTWWVHQLKLYKTSFCSKGKDARIQDFKLVILIRFDSLNTVTPNTHIFSIPLLNGKILGMLEVLGEGVQILLELQKQKNYVWGFNLLWVLKCPLIKISNLQDEHPRAKLSIFWQ